MTQNKPIFLHSLFRTGSTYLWEKFRQHKNFNCLYEPLHHILQDVTLDNIHLLLTSDYQAVHHPNLQHYYLHEYLPLLKEGERGIPLFKKEFGNDQFCCNEENPALKDYIDQLLTFVPGLVPVLKFNRTAFRIRWFKQVYPDAWHVYVLRNPRDQWQSYTELHKRTGYQDFFIMDLLKVCVNLDKTPFRPLAQYLPFVSYHDTNYEKEFDFCKIVLKTYSTEERYLIFYYIWLYALIEQVLYADLVIDINRLSTETPYKQQISSWLKEQELHDITFADCHIEEYTQHILPKEKLAELEKVAQHLVGQCFTLQDIEAFFHRLGPERTAAFSLSRNEFFFPTKKCSILENESKQACVEKLQHLLYLFAQHYSTNELEKTKINLEATNQKEMVMQLEAQLKKQNEYQDYIVHLESLHRQDTELISELKEAQENHIEQIHSLQAQLHKIVYGKTYRLGKMAVSPYVMVKKLASTCAEGCSSLYYRKVAPFFHIQNQYERKINLGKQLNLDFGRHRSGLKYGLAHLKPLHHPDGVCLDAFIERTFCWDPTGIKPYDYPWIGFIHVPPNMPDWFFCEQSNETIFSTEAWRLSEPFCKGLFTMSNYHRQYLQKRLNIPVYDLVFPSEIPELTWSWDKFVANPNKKIIQIGWWLRMLHAIYRLPKTDYQKVFLNVEHDSIPLLMKKEKQLLIEEGVFRDDMYQTVTTLNFLPDAEYDQLLCENLVLIYLYDASANNTVTECLARNTPLLINPIEPVKEYLGENYPFYYHSFEEAAEKAMNLELVHQTHQYLVNHPLKQKMSGEYFLKNFAESPIYKSLTC